MNAEDAKQRILNGKKSQAVRRKLIERTPKSAQIKARGRALSQEIVHTVALPHPIYIDSADGGNTLKSLELSVKVRLREHRRAIAGADDADRGVRWRARYQYAAAFGAHCVWYMAGDLDPKKQTETLPVDGCQT